MWQGVGDMHGSGVCMVVGMCGMGWQGVCVAGGAGGVHGRGVHSMHAPLPVDRTTDACKNITLPQTLRAVIIALLPAQ